MSDFDGELMSLYAVTQAAYDLAAQGSYVEYDLESPPMTSAESLAERTAAGTRRRAALPRQPLQRSNAFRRPNTGEKSQAAKMAMRDASLLAASDFRGTATIQGLEDALPFAQMVCSTCATDTEQLAYWIDAYGDGGEEPEGWLVANKTSDGWTWRVGPHGSQGDKHSEMMAIRAALEMAVEQITKRMQRSLGLPTLVRVFSDSQPALRKISRARHPAVEDPTMGHPDVAETMEGILHCSGVLKDLGVRQELHWVPRGMVKGTQFAASMAKVARGSPDGPGARPVEEAAAPAEAEAEAIPMAPTPAPAGFHSHARYAGGSCSFFPRVLSVTNISSQTAAEAGPPPQGSLRMPSTGHG